MIYIFAAFKDASELFFLRIRLIDLQSAIHIIATRKRNKIVKKYFDC